MTVIKLSQIKAMAIAAALLMLATKSPAQTDPFFKSVQLEWNDNSETDLAGYRLFVGNLPGSYSASYDIGKPAYAIVDLNPRLAPFFFAVKAYNRSGQESDFSNEVRYPSLPQ